MELQDKIKVAVAVLFVVAGIVFFYMIPEAQGYARAGAFLLGLVLAAGVLWVSQPGKDLVSYAQESLVEARKVVWPERKEAMQMTGLVFVFVFIMALFMWIVDSSLSWFLYDIVLKRG